MNTGWLSRGEVRSQRPQDAHRRRREQLSTEQPQGISFDAERRGSASDRVLTVFLTGAECPFSCVFCDLWQHTMPGATPPGAIPRQLAWVEAELRRQQPAPRPVNVLKLYNASNFFDSRAVPEADDADVLERVTELHLAPGARVVVECHPLLLLSVDGRRRLQRYVKGLDSLGLSLEVALGLETVAPGGLEDLAKGASLDDFAAAFDLTLQAGASVRAFVLFGIPRRAPSAADQQRRWTLQTVRWAKQHGARSASVIPVRAGNGTLERLANTASWEPPTLDELATVFVECLRLQSESPAFDVHLDTWDLQAVASGDLNEAQAAAVRHRLRSLNEYGPAAVEGADAQTSADPAERQSRA